MTPSPHLATSSISRRGFLSGAGALGVALATAGCSASAASSRRESITLYLPKYEVIPYFDKLIAEFHRSQSEVRVIRDSTSNIAADFVRKAPPDLGCFNYNNQMVEFVEHGALTDLSDIPEAQIVNPDLWPLMRQTASAPGRTAIPFSVTAASVFYNKKIFAEHGVGIPTTWSELIAACETFRRAGIDPFFNTLKDTWTISQGMFDYTVGGLVDVPDFFAGLKAEGANVGDGSKVSFEKGLAPSMEKMVELKTWSNANASSRGYSDGNVAFAQGRTAMYMQGPWALGDILTTNPKVEIGTFPLPVTDDPSDRKVRVNVDLALWIPKASKKQESARKFLSFLMSRKINDRYNAANAAFGTRVDSAKQTDPILTGMQPYYQSAKFYLGASQLIPTEIPVANYAQSIALGGAPRTQLRQLDSDWSRVALRQL